MDDYAIVLMPGRRASSSASTGGPQSKAGGWKRAARSRGSARRRDSPPRMAPAGVSTNERSTGPSCGMAARRSMRSPPGFARPTAARACSVSAIASSTAARTSPVPRSSRRRSWTNCASWCRSLRSISRTISRRSKRSSERLPGVPQVACFDTSFHRGQPAVAELVPLPREICRSGVQRYGFHGLSYEYIASVLPQVAPEIADGRVIVAHLGSGASLCAMKNRKSVDSTLGFTALDGLCMGTRPGALDPGVVLYLFQSLGLSRQGSRDDALQAIRVARHIGHEQRHARPPRQPRAGRPAGRGLLRLSRGQGDRRARRGPRWHRRSGLHRRHRRELGRGPQPDLRGLGMARHRAGRRGEPGTRAADFSSRAAGCRPG